MALCYQPWNLGFLIWVWTFPLLAALWFSPTKSQHRPWRRGFRLGYLSGLSFFGISFHWIAAVSRVAGTWLAGAGALLGLAAILGLYFGAFGAFAATVGRWSPERGETVETKGRKALLGQSLAVLRIAFLNGAAWCGLEWLRGILFSGFGWNGLGVALRDQLVLVQFAEVIGITGYSFVLFFTSTVLFCTLIRIIREVRSHRRLRPHFDLSAAAALIAGLLLYGLSAFLRPAGESIDLRARLMQMNVSFDEKWSEDLEIRQKVLIDYRDLTRAFVETNPPDLIVWPETAVSGIFSSPWVHEYLNDHVLRGDDFYLATGLEDMNLEGTEIYNTLTLFRKNVESYQMYKKTHLVPFGEYIPFRRSFPLFAWLTQGVVDDDFTAGNNYDPLLLEKEGQQIGLLPLICFEDTLPRVARHFLRPGPQVFLNVTNDGWFDGTSQAQQHFDNALFRCIEFRRPMIRCANTGISGFIDEFGSIFDRTGRESGPRIIRDPETGETALRGSLPATLAIPLHPPRTIYARIGDTFSILMGLIALLAALGRFLSVQKPGSSAGTSSPM